jgi:hypothetical protein
MMFWVLSSPAFATLVYSINNLSNDFLSFDTATPNTQTIINSSFPTPTWSFDSDSAGTTYYAIEDSTKLYGTVNPSTGVFSSLGTVTGLLSGTQSGMSIDPTTGVVYLSSTTIGQSTLYTLNLATGVASVVGSTTVAPGVVDIAFDATGQLFATDVVNDSLYSINPANGTASLIGAVGLDLNFGQGLDFDYSTGILYGALFDNSSTTSKFSSINTTTGLATVIADMGFNQYEIAIASPIPVPAAVWLFGSGLLGLVGIARRKKAA